MYEREKEAWARLKPLIKKDEQKFAVLKDDGLVGLYDDLLEAMREGHRICGPHFLTASLFPIFGPLNPYEYPQPCPS